MLSLDEGVVAQAIARHLGLHSGRMRIDTDAGIRDVTFAPTDDPSPRGRPALAHGTASARRVRGGARGR